MWVLLIIVVLLLIGYLSVKFNPSFGGKAAGTRLQRMLESPNYRNGKFHNQVETIMQTDDLPFFQLLKEFLFAKGDHVPSAVIPVYPIRTDQFQQKVKPARITWLGHSTLIIEVAGKTILTDPVFGKRISPFSYFGSQAFPYSHPYKMTDLLHVDLVLISHDHYDHLDYDVIRQLADTDVPFITALGVGSHLERWGINDLRITELDWWESFTFEDDLRITATPSRHFSGRGLNNRFFTLWASWVIVSSEERLFFGADSGYFNGFKQVGEKYGPFDLTMLECGQYSRYWPFIHMAPEETFQAAIDLQSRALLPIHWGKYKLSIHPWREPVERLLKAAENNQLPIVTPNIGESFILGDTLPSSRWWREIG